MKIMYSAFVKNQSNVFIYLFPRTKKISLKINIGNKYEILDDFIDNTIYPR